MLDILTLIGNLISQIVGFLDSFYIIGHLSILKLMFIVLIFDIAIKFLVKNKRGE